jgi:hypothetical protein
MANLSRVARQRYELPRQGRRGAASLSPQIPGAKPPQRVRIGHCAVVASTTAMPPDRRHRGSRKVANELPLTSAATRHLPLWRRGLEGWTNFAASTKSPADSLGGRDPDRQINDLTQLQGVVAVPDSGEPWIARAVAVATTHQLVFTPSTPWNHPASVSVGASLRRCRALATELGPIRWAIRPIIPEVGMIPDPKES